MKQFININYWRRFYFGFCFSPGTVLWKSNRRWSIFYPNRKESATENEFSSSLILEFVEGIWVTWNLNSEVQFLSAKSLWFSFWRDTNPKTFLFQRNIKEMLSMWIRCSSRAFFPLQTWSRLEGIWIWIIELWFIDSIHSLLSIISISMLFFFNFHQLKIVIISIRASSLVHIVIGCCPRSKAKLLLGCRPGKSDMNLSLQFPLKWSTWIGSFFDCPMNCSIWWWRCCWCLVASKPFNGTQKC